MPTRKRGVMPSPDQYYGKMTTQVDPLFWAALVVLAHKNEGEPFQSILRRLVMAEVDRSELGDKAAEYALQILSFFPPTKFTKNGNLRGA